jgi:hypothetical protein
MSKTVIVEITRSTNNGSHVSRREVSEELWKKIQAMKNKPGLWKYAREVQSVETVDLKLKGNEEDEPVKEKKKPGPKPKNTENNAPELETFE